MKLFKIHLTSLLLFISTALLLKADPTPPGLPLPKCPKDPSEINLPKVGSRPHTPGYDNEVTVTFDGHLLTICFAEPEGMATVVLSENGTHTIYRGYHLTTAAGLNKFIILQ